MQRLKNTLRNMIWNFSGQFVLIIAGLLMKRVLINTVGIEKIGLNYVFNDIVSLLSIAELGLTGIIAYHLYEPLERGDQLQIIKIMRFFRKAYFAIGCFVILVGIGIVPFLGFFIKNTASISYTYIITAFILFLFRNSVGYFTSYKFILPYADQKEYLVIKVDIVSTIIYWLVAYFVIINTHNFLIILFLEIVKKIINDLILIGFVNKRYPFVRKMEKVNLERSEIKKIGVDIRDAFVSKISIAVISTTDNILMSKFLGLGITGRFSNYTLVLYTVQKILKQIISSAQASMGNLVLTEKKEVVYSVVKKMTFISFFTVSICGCCLLQLSTPFVALFFGKDYTLSQIVVLVSVFNIFLDIMQLTMVQLSEAQGLFSRIKKINLLSCIINVILSVIGVKTIGIVGILLGTLISRAIEYSLRIVLNFKEILPDSSKNYMRKIILYTFIFIAELIAVQSICYFINVGNPFVQFAIFALIAGGVPLIINCIIFNSSEDFRYMLQLINYFWLKTKSRT